MTVPGKPAGGFTRPVGLMQREPAVVVGTATAVVVAVLQLLVVFGVPLDLEQQAAIVGVVAVLAPLVQMVLTRARVYAPATVSRVLDGIDDEPERGTGKHRAEPADVERLRQPGAGPL